jgi:4-amino-4-deoxy-L-arabinose transferase-like glycosyltransferase
MYDVKPQGRKVEYRNGGDMFCTQGVVILIIVFFLAFAPLLSSTARYRGDESLYNFAAIRMMQTGDYFTPYHDDGSLRLEKPIFIYWAMVASYKIFGINLFSSRIPFLIAGCLVIWLTYKLSLLLFRRTDGAFIAAAVIASNLTLFHVAVRSTPDTFLCLFVSISLYGFARLIFNRDQRMINYLFAYVGAGLAAATKGGWGLLPVAFAFFFCYFRKRDTIRLRELIDVKSIAIAVFVASFWYIIAYYQHGDVFVYQFFGDQAGERFSGSKWYIVENMLTYVFAIVKEFLPWSFILILLLITHRDKNVIGHFFHEHKEACIFIVGWYLSLCLVFSLGNIQRTRFMFPSYPLVSALYAALLVPLVRQGKDLSASILQHLEWIILAACFMFGLLLVLAGIFIDMRLVVGGILTIIVVAILYATLFRRGRIYSLVTVSLCIILIFSVTENFMSRVIYNSPAPLVAHKVREHAQSQIEIAAVDLSISYRAQIYVLSGGCVRVAVLYPDMILDNLKEFQFIVLSERSKEQLNLKGYSVEECGYTYKDKRFKTRSLWSLRKVDDLRTLISEQKKHYYLLIKSESSQH